MMGFTFRREIASSIRLKTEIQRLLFDELQDGLYSRGLIWRVRQVRGDSHYIGGAQDSHRSRGDFGLAFMNMLRNGDRALR